MARKTVGGPSRPTANNGTCPLQDQSPHHQIQQQQSSQQSKRSNNRRLLRCSICTRGRVAGVVPPIGPFEHGIYIHERCALYSAGVKYTDVDPSMIGPQGNVGTPGEAGYVPKGCTKVYDIGSVVAVASRGLGECCKVCRRRHATVVCSGSCGSRYHVMCAIRDRCGLQQHSKPRCMCQMCGLRVVCAEETPKSMVESVGVLGRSQDRSRDSGYKSNVSSIGKQAEGSRNRIHNRDVLERQRQEMSYRIERVQTRSDEGLHNAAMDKGTSPRANANLCGSGQRRTSSRRRTRTSGSKDSPTVSRTALSVCEAVNEHKSSSNTLCTSTTSSRIRAARALQFDDPPAETPLTQLAQSQQRPQPTEGDGQQELQAPKEKTQPARILRPGKACKVPGGAESGKDSANSDLETMSVWQDRADQLCQNTAKVMIAAKEAMMVEDSGGSDWNPNLDDSQMDRLLEEAGAPENVVTDTTPTDTHPGPDDAVASGVDAVIEEDDHEHEDPELPTPPSTPPLDSIHQPPDSEDEEVMDTAVHEQRPLAAGTVASTAHENLQQEPQGLRDVQLPSMTSSTSAIMSERATKAAAEAVAAVLAASATQTPGHGAPAEGGVSSQRTATAFGEKRSRQKPANDETGQIQSESTMTSTLGPSQTQVPPTEDLSDRRPPSAAAGDMYLCSSKRRKPEPVKSRDELVAIMIEMIKMPSDQLDANVLKNFKTEYVHMLATVYKQEKNPGSVDRMHITSGAFNALRRISRKKKKRLIDDGDKKYSSKSRNSTTPSPASKKAKTADTAKSSSVSSTDGVKTSPNAAAPHRTGTISLTDAHVRQMKRSMAEIRANKPKRPHTDEHINHAEMEHGPKAKAMAAAAEVIASLGITQGQEREEQMSPKSNTEQGATRASLEDQVESVKDSQPQQLQQSTEVEDHETVLKVTESEIVEVMQGSKECQPTRTQDAELKTATVSATSSARGRGTKKNSANPKDPNLTVQRRAVMSTLTDAAESLPPSDPPPGAAPGAAQQQSSLKQAPSTSLLLEILRKNSAKSHESAFGRLAVSLSNTTSGKDTKG
eukprot:Clim_evm4s198 gene=Clim_evmTU4s198